MEERKRLSRAGGGRCDPQAGAGTPGQPYPQAEISTRRGRDPWR